MNPRFDTTMRTAFRTAAMKAIDKMDPNVDPTMHDNLGLVDMVCTSLDRGVGAPRPARAR